MMASNFFSSPFSFLKTDSSLCKRWKKKQSAPAGQWDKKPDFYYQHLVNASGEMLATIQGVSVRDLVIQGGNGRVLVVRRIRWTK